MVKIMENPIKMDDSGVPLFLETPIYHHAKSGKDLQIKLYGGKNTGGKIIESQYRYFVIPMKCPDLLREMHN